LREVMTPHERTVFELLTISASNADASLRLLEELVHHWPDRAELVEELAERRREAEDAAEAVFAHAHRTFVTAIDREDLLALSDALHAAVIHAEGVAGLLVAYETGRGRERARRVTHLVVDAGTHMLAGVRGLRRLDGVAASVTALQEVERETRHLLREALADLVGEEPPAKTMMAWRDVFDELARTVDACAAGARALHAIELKRR
jgi:uncharacterized protein